MTTLKRAITDSAEEPMAALAPRTLSRIARHPVRSLEGLRVLRRTLSRELRMLSGDEVVSLTEAGIAAKAQKETRIKVTTKNT